MDDYTGRLEELLLEPYKNASARLSLAGGLAPKAGQYLLANRSASPEEILPITLFPAGYQARASTETSLLVSGDLPAQWGAGDQLTLRGPLGKGFQLPRRLRRLALIALDERPARLLPLLAEARERSLQVTLFADQDAPELPLEVEVQPLSAASEARSWADFIALDLRPDQVEDLPEILGSRRGLDGQALVAGPMPCGGMAQCGICSLRIGNADKLVCEDGPVFELSTLLS